MSLIHVIVERSRNNNMNLVGCLFRSLSGAETNGRFRSLSGAETTNFYRTFKPQSIHG